MFKSDTDLLNIETEQSYTITFNLDYSMSYQEKESYSSGICITQLVFLTWEGMSKYIKTNELIYVHYFVDRKFSINIWHFNLW